MDRTQVITFNLAYAAEATPEEKQLVNDMLSVWAKFETAAQKNPALLRKGILFGLALQKCIAAGTIIPKPAKRNRKETSPSGSAE